MLKKRHMNKLGPAHLEFENRVINISTKDIEIVKWKEDIEDYMEREVYPHVPDAKWFWEENLGTKKPVIKTETHV